MFHNEWISDYDDGYWNSSHLGGLALSIANLFKKKHKLKTSVPKWYRCFYEKIVLEKIE